MITLLAALAGFISSAFPEILKVIRDNNDKKHELAILDRQIEVQKEGFSQKLQEIQEYGHISEAKAIYKTFTSGIHWVDALNGSVRPVLAYSFFVLYGYVKFIQYSILTKLAPPFVQFDILWAQDDQAIFVCIISFYFGQRALVKFKR